MDAGLSSDLCTPILSDTTSGHRMTRGSGSAAGWSSLPEYQRVSTTCRGGARQTSHKLRAARQPITGAQITPN
jgi:hypothetical protein